MRIVRNAVPVPPPTRFGWPRLCRLPRAVVEDTPGAEWEDFVEDGLGQAHGVCVEIEGGWVLGIVRYVEASEPYEVYALADEADLPAVLRSLLAATGLAEADLPWVEPAALL
ncbi:MAG TPA: hypothetical protein VGX28_05395 [Frankiaceae bacterium]|jgi:hypothetical protein|nr:hypothetical protein [Frankiaceae bacterium]